MVDTPGDMNDVHVTSWSADHLHPTTISEQLVGSPTPPEPFQPPATPIYWCNPVTMMLEQIEKNTQCLLHKWPKDNGIPLPNEVLGVLDNIKTKVRARDKEKV